MTDHYSSPGQTPPSEEPVADGMIDLHCHILPGLDDGAPDLSVALEMARLFVADGVSVVACTPHILPGLYHNDGPQIRLATAKLQEELRKANIPLKLVTGADNHITPTFVAELGSGHLLSLGDTRYVLVEPPHHIAPPRLEDVFFDLMVAGYVPILTHPERLSWIEAHYPTIRRLAEAGVWMQLTAGSLAGAFGRRPRYWSERMLDEGCAQILATDAHDVSRRPPNLRQGRELAANRVGDVEANHMVATRPRGVLANAAPSNLGKPVPAGAGNVEREGSGRANKSADVDGKGHEDAHSALRGIVNRLRFWGAGRGS
jgi:protein-tyrosine phosphatase